MNANTDASTDPNAPDPAWTLPSRLRKEEVAKLVADVFPDGGRFCVRSLLDEKKRRGSGGFLPGQTAFDNGTIDVAGMWRLFRSLCNLRPPLPVHADFLAVQDAWIESRRGAAVSPADIANTDFSEKNGLAVWQGDITRLACAAIVNAANPTLLGCFTPLHNCIDNQIHTWAGVQLRLACDKLIREQGHEEPVGRAQITPGYNLPARCVLHTVGPKVETAVTDRHREQLASCYTSSLAKAVEHGLSSVAFCCISTGVYNFPADEACDIAVSTVLAFRREHPDAPRVIFNTFSEKDTCLYRKRIAEVNCRSL